MRHRRAAVPGSMMELMIRIPDGNRLGLTAGRACDLPEGCRVTIQRLFDAAAAMQQQLERAPALPPQLRRSGNRGRRVLQAGVGLLAGLLLLLTALLSGPPSAASSSAYSSPANPAPSPIQLRQQPSSDRPAAESLVSNIRGYYARVPGGFDGAVRTARAASADHPLKLFPPLCYESLDRPVPIVHAPPHLPRNGRIGGYFSPGEQQAYIAAGFPAARVQEVVEHELTHAWQFAPRGQTGLPGAMAADHRRYHKPLGEPGQHRRILDCMFSFSGRDNGIRIAFVRDYLCRPSEIDVRLAAFKRWWAWNHGELLDLREQARHALEHPRPGDLDAWPDVNDAVRIWDSYRNQPEIQELLLARMLQVL
ncbi:MAG TPA: hypothetical protein VLH09_01030 [Bryobacteraceae bacterium]|nr:hypothetical protein [Bryobacteraceae bacterium]